MISDIQKRMKSITQKRDWAKAHRIPSLEFSEVEANSGWFKKNQVAVSFNEDDRSFTVDLNSNNYTYLTYREQNIDFQQAPVEENIAFDFSSQQTLVFKGTKSESVSVELFIIEYKNRQKVGIHRFEMNSEGIIPFSQSTDSIRLALRVKGQGTFKIESMLINDRGFWNQSELLTEGNYIVLEQNQWYMPKSDQLYYDPFNKKFNVSFEDKQFAYVTHREGNAAFSAQPASPVAVHDDTLSVCFQGEKENSVDVRLAIIFYQDGKKVGTDELKLNNKKLIHFQEEYNSIRLAVRVSGKGEFKLDDIIINNVSYWWVHDVEVTIPKMTVDALIKYALNEHSLRGWQESNNGVIYHPWNQLFQSKLKGQEFIHLTAQHFNTSENISVAVDHDSTYVITPAGEVYEGIELVVYAVGYKNNKQNEIHQLELNEKAELRFKKDTEHVEFLIRVTESGFFKGLQINIQEKPIEITNSAQLELQASDWFASAKKLVQLSTSEKGLHGLVNIEAGKNSYISYKETNNSFKMLPTHHIMTMQKGFEYEFTVKGKADEDVAVIPMFIGYSDEEKLQVLQLKFNSMTKVQIHPDITQFRIALRVSGKGEFEVHTISINEMKSIEREQSLNYVAKQEVDAFNMLPPKPIKEMKMAVIFDEFTTASYEHECKLIKMTPDNWLEVMTKEQPDLLMVESAWRGNGGVWNKRVGYYGEENMKSLYSLLAWCKEHNVPTVFWNKEDPVHFNRFIETARRFDYIFTTDENMVPYYQERAGHQNAFALPFAAQPAIHNPIKIVDERENKACFAGSYYRHHEERCIDMDRLLDAAAKVGLDIYDRNYIQNLKGLMPNHQFPDRFVPYVKGNLKYYEIDKAYKGYKVMINVNTVKESPTMFSRRVYEGLACGTPVISTYAQGIGEIFGDLVYMSEDPTSLHEEFKQLLEDERYYEEKALTGIRDVLTKHTYTHRLEYIIEKVGLNFAFELPTVTVVAIANTRQEFENIVDQFNRQAYENKQLYILVDTFDGYLDLYNKYNTKTIHTFVRSYMHNYLNIRDWITSEYVTYFGQDSYYGQNYLLDLMLGTTFTDSDFIGKTTHYSVENGKLEEKNAGQEYEFVRELSSQSSVAKTNVYSNLSLEQVINLFEQDQSLASYAKYGKQFFSNDKFNYLKLEDSSKDDITAMVNKIEL